MGRAIKMLVAGTGAFGIAVAIAMAAPTNGNFEKGNFDGWERVDDNGDIILPRAEAKGKWQVYKGKLKFDFEEVPPRGGDAPPNAKLAEPPQGKFAAGLGSQGPGTHILHRVLSVSGKQQLSFKLSYWNTADDFYVQDTLSPEPPGRRAGSMGPSEFPNQQLRVDIMDPEAPVDSLKNANIVKTIFRTKPGDKRRLDYTKFKTTLKQGEYRLRIAEVDNQSNFMVGVDAVKLKQK